MRLIRLFAVSFLLLAPVIGCAKSEENPASNLSEAQRDTVLSKSDIPGAAAVGAALNANGKEIAHSAQVDSAAGR